MNILGINAYHGDSSAAVVVNGQLVAAVEEERFNRIKHWAGFPKQSIQFVLEAAGLTIGDVDHVALSFNPKANLARKIGHTVWHRPALTSIMDRLQRQRKSTTVPQQLAAACGVNESQVLAKIHQVEHHDAHIASGFLLSPFEHAAIMSIDGMGDFCSTVTAFGNGTAIKKHNQVFYPHSLGYLYNAITMFLGFPNYGDEYKVMGLAPYGKPTYLEQFRKIVRPQGDTFELNLKYFEHVRQGVNMTWTDGSPQVMPFHSQQLEVLLGPARLHNEALETRHENIAASLQCVSEEIIMHMLTKLHEQTDQQNLVLVGGCAMNSVANGKIRAQTPFKNVYVPVGAADNGTCIGAAFHVLHHTLGRPRSFRLEHAYWGDAFDTDACRSAVNRANLMKCSDQELLDRELLDPQTEDRERAPARNTVVQTHEFSNDDLLEHAVDAICDGKVVAWFQGRMEFGARALGNRSILADPRRADMRDIINMKIKFRERFRPFAPSILEEHVGEYFDTTETAPFMERVLPIKLEKRDQIPAVTHVDGTGRLQSVSRKTNPLYWGLIQRFYQRTGVPLLLNTSLNENEPIVRTPDEAIRCFQRTSMDMLIMGHSVIERVIKSDRSHTIHTHRATGSKPPILAYSSTLPSAQPTPAE